MGDDGRRGGAATRERGGGDRGGDARSAEDRRLDELLSELRVVLPGTTVLFAFLLSLPFTVPFRDLGPWQEAAFFVAFLATAVAIVLLVAEVGYHRLQGRDYDKGRMIRTTSRQATGAIALLGVALVAVVYLVSDVVYPSSVAVPLSVAVAGLAAWSWAAIPLSRRRDRR